MKIFKIDDFIGILRAGGSGSIRMAVDGEEPDFIQEFDKLCTGICGTRRGVPYSFALNPPVMLQAECGYVIELDAEERR